jgi:DNA primase
MAHQEGFDNVVGSLGTALTAGHVELVTRYAPRIALAYDVDAAGQSAAAFGATELTALIGQIERSEYRGRLTDVDMVRLPEGKDPDEVIRDDPETWRRATDSPQPIMEFLIDRAAQRVDPRTISGREQLINAVVPTLRTITDPVRRDGYVQLLARRAGVDERVVREALTQREPPAGLRRGGGVGSRINLEAIMATPGALDPLAVEKALSPPEATLLRLLLLHPEGVDRVRDRLRPGLLSSTPARELWRALREATEPAGGHRFERTAFLEGLEPTLEAIARTLYARTDPVPDDEPALVQAIEQSLLMLEAQSLIETLEFKRAEQAEAGAAGDTELVARLTREVRDLQEQRLDLDRKRDSVSLLANRRRRPAVDASSGAAPGGAAIGGAAPGGAVPGGAAPNGAAAPAASPGDLWPGDSAE